MSIQSRNLEPVPIHQRNKFRKKKRIFGQYHKDYPDEMKLHIVSELSKPQPKLQLVFASVALGMGLNAPFISKVIHFRPPTTLEQYFQEEGRARCSGQSAKAVITSTRMMLQAIERVWIQALRNMSIQRSVYGNI